MSIGRPPSPSRRDQFGDTDSPLAVPLFRVGRTRLHLTYGVFFAASIVFTAVMVARSQPGNSDLPYAVAIGVAFWCSGWVAQTTGHMMAAWSLGLPTRRLVIGVIGVEPEPRHWRAKPAAIVSMLTIAMPFILAMAYRLVASGFQTPSWQGISVQNWLAPGLGFASHDSLWRSAAWLCCFQVVLQMFPLPRSMGRQWCAAIVHLLANRLPLVWQISVLRRSLLVISILTLLVGLGMMLGENSTTDFPKWPFFACLSVLLWGSCYRRDLKQFVERFQTEDRVVQDSVHEAQPTLRWRIDRMIRGRRDRRRVRDAMEKERREAVDASKLDDILQRLHQDGAAKLSGEDREILKRVSETLRTHRE